MADDPEDGRQRRRGRFYAVLKREDGEAVAFCDEITDAARVAIRQSRRFDCDIREVEAEISFRITGAPFAKRGR